jgi:heterodisulfide reductase subunit B2
MESEKLGFYPGCTLEGSSSGFTDSLHQVFKALDMPVKEMEEWSCCGATSAHAMDHEFHLGLNLRNLSLAEAQGFKEIVAPCAACYHRLASSNNEFQSDEAVLKSINALTGLNYQGKVKVKNILEYLTSSANSKKISNQVTSPLSNIKVACYYGCLNTRIPRMQPFDLVEYPNTMDQVVQTLGAETIDWSYKTECCGAGLSVTMEHVSLKLVSNILKDAIAKEADCIAVACPMCHVNLDTKQDKIRDQYKVSESIPIYYITQLMGLAFGIKEQYLGIKQNFVPPLQI